MKVTHKVQESIRRPAYRDFIANLIAFFKPNTKEQVVSSDDALLIKSSLDALGRDNYAIFPKGYFDCDFDRVRDYLSSQEMYDRWRDDLGFFTLDTIPDATHVANIPIHLLLGYEPILKLANDPRILNLVESYFGCKPILDTVDSWWSFPGRSHAENEQFFHRDNDSFRFLKVFFYLSDVNVEAGPHCVVPKSKQSTHFLKKRRRYSDKDVKEVFPEYTWRYFEGPVGTSFVEDTYSLHKGTLPVSKPRLLLQFRYCINRSIFSKPSKIITPEQVSRLGIDRYVNQLYLKV